MSRIRVTKEFTFETAHALLNYDGPCRNVHGHSYRLYVTVSGIPERTMEDPKFGMVIDFGELKKLVNQEVVKRFDHAVVISSETGAPKLEEMRNIFGNLLVVDYQPTCENMVADMALRIRKRLPEGIDLHSLKLYETATSYAEWFAADNE